MESSAKAHPMRLCVPHALALLIAIGGAGMRVAAADETATPLSVAIDQARIIAIDRPAATVIVGNPAIVDVEVLNAERLVLTGKSYGITNLVILDNKGEPILDQKVAVQTFEENTVRVYRQASRVTYACAPKCEPTATIGDDDQSFGQAAQQYTTHQQIASQASQK